MTLLAQTYVHLRPFDADDRTFNLLGEAAQAIAVEAARETYDQDVVVDIRLEEGSLKTWITVAGVLSVYGAIADYKGFKESVGEMVQDARSFGDMVSDGFTKKADVSDAQVFRVERRLKTPGKLQRLLWRVEQLNEASKTMNPIELSKQLGEIKRELEQLQHDIRSDEIKQIQDLVFENLPVAPPTRDHGRVDLTPRHAMRPQVSYQDAFALEDLAGDTSSSAPAPMAQTRRAVFHRTVRVTATITQVIEAEGWPVQETDAT